MAKIKKYNKIPTTLRADIITALNKGRGFVILPTVNANGGELVMQSINDFIDEYERKLWDSTLMDGLSDEDWSEYNDKVSEVKIKPKIKKKK